MVKIFSCFDFVNFLWGLVVLVVFVWYYVLMFNVICGEYSGLFVFFGEIYLGWFIVGLFVILGF